VGYTGWHRGDTRTYFLQPEDTYLTKQLAILGAIIVLPAFAQLSSDTTEKIAPRHHGPIQDKVEHGDGTSTSTNWSGYAVTGSAFTSAEASWIVPTATCSSGHDYAAFWVGIDGYSSKTVEQTGTDSDCVGKKPSYYAWYEFYPQYPVEVNMTITPGDRMSASVVYNGSEFTVTITDVTTGKSYSKSSKVAGAKRSSAEWIAEAPCCRASGAPVPLADFGTVLFGEDSTSVSGTGYAQDSSTNGPIGSFSTIEQITMERGGGVKKAIPSGLSGDGTSFSVNWAAH